MTHDEFVTHYEDLLAAEEGEKFPVGQLADTPPTDSSAMTDQSAPDTSDGRDWDCLACGVDTGDEYYMVQFDLWNTVVPPEWQSGLLCIGCLEKLLGRELNSKDFTECLLNYERSDKSARLLDRLGDWFRLFDAWSDPETTPEQRDALRAEAWRREVWEQPV